ncbi:MAG: NUDIX hydrolase [Undibacterium sp.]|nr:NUDIX hydrolase [Opitutaceae bacterium]
MSTSSSPPGPVRWERLEERTLAATRVLDLRSVHFRHPRREVDRDFVVIAASDWCNVIALTPDGQLVLVRQFRYGINDFSLEIPGGIIDPGEDPVVAGLRELREETGFVGTEARLLASVHPNPAIQNNRCHLVLVENATASSVQQWDHDEEIEVVTAPVDDVLAWARAGKITHSLVVCGLMHFEPIWRVRMGRGV